MLRSSRHVGLQLVFYDGGRQFSSIASLYNICDADDEDERKLKHEQQRQKQRQGSRFASLPRARGPGASYNTTNSRIAVRRLYIESRTFSTNVTQAQKKSVEKVGSPSSSSFSSVEKVGSPSSSSSSPSSASSVNISPEKSTSTALTNSHDTTPPNLIGTIVTKTISLSKFAVAAFGKFLVNLPSATFFYLTHPAVLRDKILEIKEHAKHEAKHYYMGTKLLVADVRTSRKIFFRALSGGSMTRRERKQLLRTTTDLFRLVPMSMFVIIPFMELALPFALKMFPNMLPSTFQDTLKAEESMKRELKSRIAMTGFFQETLKELAKGQQKMAKAKVAKRREAAKALQEAEQGDGDSAASSSIPAEDESEELIGAKEFLDFLDRARSGEPLPPNAIIKFSAFFKDDLTLDNMTRMQLVNMCRYMSVSPYGSAAFLRFQLRYKVRALKEDDQRILWEGVDSLTKTELREACRERGMRSTGLSKESYKKSIKQWLELSVVNDVPISLLIMSRSFFLKEEQSQSAAQVDAESNTNAPDQKALSGIAEAISGMDDEILNEVVLEVATPEEARKNPDVVKIKLESLEHQNELIKEEYEEKKRAEEKAAKKAEEKKRKACDKTAAKVAATTTPSTESEPEEKLAELLSNLEDPTAKPLKTVETISEISTEATPATSAVSPAAAKETEDSKKSDDNVEEKEMVDEKAQAADDEDKDEDKDEDEDEEKEELSFSEIEALSELVRENPVESERTELERLKLELSTIEMEGLDIEVDLDFRGKAAAANEGSGDATGEQGAVDQETPPKTDATEGKDPDSSDLGVAETVSAEDDTTASIRHPDLDFLASNEVGDAEAKEAFTTQDAAVAAESDKETTVDFERDEKYDEKYDERDAEEDAKKDTEAVKDAEEESDDHAEAKTTKKLKDKVEKMVDILESQLADIESQIGTKLHVLDKDNDGVFSVEELHEALNSVLKREISNDEFMDIVADLDLNSDGFIKVEDFEDWVKFNKFANAIEKDQEFLEEEVVVEAEENMPGEGDVEEVKLEEKDAEKEKEKEKEDKDTDMEKEKEDLLEKYVEKEMEKKKKTVVNEEIESDENGESEKIANKEDR